MQFFLWEGKSKEEALKTKKPFNNKTRPSPPPLPPFSLSPKRKRERRTGGKRKTTIRRFEYTVIRLRQRKRIGREGEDVLRSRFHTQKVEAKNWLLIVMDEYIKENPPRPSSLIHLHRNRPPSLGGVIIHRQKKDSVCESEWVKEWKSEREKCSTTSSSSMVSLMSSRWVMVHRNQFVDIWFGGFSWLVAVIVRSRPTRHPGCLLSFIFSGHYR